MRDAVKCGRGLVAHDSAGSLAAKLAAAYGNANDPKTLSDSLAAMVKLVRELRAARGSELAHQLDEGGLDEAYLARIETLAADVKSSGEALKGGLATGSVSQSELDIQDGVCLTHMERLLGVYSAAHRADPTYPLLLPIATRSVLGHGHPRTRVTPQGNAPGTGN